ncbi:protein bunched, class 2/F/G isoform-like isoform X1 [Anthonomus grandis grandis]|uniref:protein bunched, class 2/F/G isoform-like isoform X1 n=1 Tax=Anthonomus grandis grandis TaxID=2921223 RepID=UPI0021651B33|nr:protein bunched, class 2/F/G isoform-like isoform X1 [Anthonomus grandis grandis]
MTSLSAKNKKGTVIHRTTSETLRLGDEVVNANQMRISTISRKKNQATSPSCSFQITGVISRYDQEDESADDLDESHTDEISRVTDNETPSFSEDSRDDQHPALQLPQTQQNFNQNVCTLAKPPSPVKKSPTPPPPSPIVQTIEEPKKIKSNINDLGRFRVVKLESMAPFSRGRWTCYDYVDDSSDLKQNVSSFNISATTKPYWGSSCQPSYLYTGSITIPEPIPIYVPSSNERPMQISSHYALPTSRMSFTSCNSVDTVINNSSFDTNQNRQSLTSDCKIVGVIPKNVLTTEHEKGLNPNDNIGASVSCTATIDTKIEHALDVVKNHLTHAVRLEVEELKIKINELVERISFLESENNLLKANVTPDVLADLANQRT